MSSYDSNRSGHLHPQYQQQQPPYPTTPGGPSQPQTYFPPIPEQQPVYSTSPTHQPSYSTSQPFYSTSPTSPRGYIPQASSTHRRTSSTSSYNSQRPTHLQQPSMPMTIPIPSRQPHEQYQHQYAASYPPPTQQHGYAPQQPQAHGYEDGEDRYEDHAHHYGGLDPKTEREYKRRYAKDKASERRPTLGGSLLSVVGKVGRAFERR